MNKDFLSNFSVFSIHDEGYSRNALYVLNLIYAFYFSYRLSENWKGNLYS